MNIHQKKKILCNGFTIIEMLIALSIIALLSTLVIANFTSLRVNSNLNSETEQLGALLRQTQLWALSGQTRGGIRPVGGWALHVEECSVGSCKHILFADTNPAGVPNRIYDAGLDELASEYVLDPSINVISVFPSNAGVLDIDFDSPYAGIYFNGMQVDAEAVIVLEHEKTGAQRTVRIDRDSGRINLE